MSTEERRACIAAAWAPVRVLAAAWTTVTVFAIFAYAATVSSPTLGNVDWHDAARAGTSIFLLAMGGPAEVENASVSLMPLSVTLFIWWFVCRSFLAMGIDSWAQAASAAASSFVFTLLVGLAALPGAGRFGGAAGAAVLTCAAMARARWRTSRPDGRVWNLLEGCRGELRPVLRALAVVSVGLLVVALVLGRSAVAAVNGYYVQGAVGAVMLTLVQLAYLPNIVVWVASFALGAGFSVGRGTDFSAFGVTSLQLPAIPVFGALPSPGVRMAWLPVLLACLALAWFVWRSRAYSSLKEASAAAGACLGCLLALGIAAAFLSGGAIGPGRMSDVGPRPLPLGLGFALAIGLPCVLGLVAPRAAAALRSRATGRPQEADAEEGPSTTGFSSPQADRLSHDAADSSASDGRRDLENRTFDRPSKWQGNRRDDTFVK